MRVIARRFLKRAIQDLPDELDPGVEDVLGVLGAYVRIEPREKRPGQRADRQPPWARCARFGLPSSPHSSRVTSPRGERSFHLTKNKVVKRTAAQFDSYAKDKVATLNEDGPQIERELALSAAARDEYVLGHGGDEFDRSPAFLTTLDQDDSVRASQWDEIELFERGRRVNPDGRPPKLSIYYERDPVFFDQAATAAECPAGLRKLIERAHRRFEKGKAPGERSAERGVGWEDDTAESALAWLQGLPGWRGGDAENRLARYSEGRGAQTVLAMEGEYCSEFDPAARHRIRHGLNDFLQRQRNVGDDPSDGSFIALIIADHLPGPLNDSRNIHFHLQTALTRAWVSGEDLTFADRKVDAMTRDTFIPRLRAEFARLSNVELDKIGAAFRLHPGSLKQMGCSEETPQLKIGQHATVLERAGVPTEQGWSNDLEGWRRIMRAADLEHERRLAAIGARSADAQRNDPEGRSGVTLKQAIGELREAAVLRHDAQRIEILIEMARSRPARAVTFTPAYIDVSRGKNAAGWRDRFEEAVAWLNVLDRDLEVERTEIAKRLTSAADKEAAANQLLSGANNNPLPERAVVMNPHRAVALIADAPMFVTRKRGRFSVEPADDRDNLVAGVDLLAVQKRLALIFQTQQRELAQVAAFIARHGAAISPGKALRRPSTWLEQSWQRWAGTAVFARIAADPIDGLKSATRPNGEELPACADFPSLADAPVLGGVLKEPFAVARATVLSGTEEMAAEMPISVPTAMPAHAVPKRTVWTEDEYRYLGLVELNIKRQRENITRDVDRALSVRAGADSGITPFTALLLRRIYKGFDPAKVPLATDTGHLSKDQIDAGEILTLSRVPRFAGLVSRARSGDQALKAQVEQAVSSTDPYRHGQVKVVRDIVRFDPQKYVDSPLYLPYDLIKPVLARLETGEIPLSRHAGLTGIYDASVLELAQHNYLPLLNPAVQVRLEVIRRIREEQKIELLARIASGDLAVEARLSVDPVSKATTARVAATGSDETQHSLICRLAKDPMFYFECRRAQSGDGLAELQRHSDPVVRAYLRAFDEQADGAILSLMVQRMKQARPNIDLTVMSESDRDKVWSAMAPAIKSFQKMSTLSRRRGSFHRPNGRGLQR